MAMQRIRPLFSDRMAFFPRLSLGKTPAKLDLRYAGRRGGSALAVPLPFQPPIDARNSPGVIFCSRLKVLPKLDALA